jgi:hypothetical protein
VSVPVVAGGYVVNTGRLLARWTNDRCVLCYSTQARSPDRDIVLCHSTHARSPCGVCSIDVAFGSVSEISRFLLCALCVLQVAICDPPCRPPSLGERRADESHLRVLQLPCTRRDDRVPSFLPECAGQQRGQVSAHQCRRLLA